MNEITKNHLTVITIIVAIILVGCKKEQIPVLTTIDVSNLAATTATSGGNITEEGSSTVISRGVCWSAGTTPTLADNKTTDGAGAGSFTSNLTGLSGATTFYVRAYATNSAGTGYGMALSFITLGQAPTPAGATASNINVTTATLNGSVNANYLSTVVTFEYGTTNSYGSTATPSQSPITGNAVTNISADITGLTAGAIYHYRIKAVNSLGTTYGSDLTFTTLGLVPTVTALAATNITSIGAALNGTANANYLSTVVTFEYGTTTNYGSTATAIQSPLTGSISTNVSSNISGLIGGTIYHFRVKAVNSLGTSYGSDLTFTTLGLVPTVTTLDATNITQTSVTMNGMVNANYLSTIVTFEYGTTASYGITATATQSPVIGNTNINVSADISGLAVGTIYHYRVKAENPLGVVYGVDKTFSITDCMVCKNVSYQNGIIINEGSETEYCGVDLQAKLATPDVIVMNITVKVECTLGYTSTPITDIDGNSYKTISLGSQVWMRENLKTTKYNDGTPIPNITVNSAWAALTTGAYCDYDNTPSNSTTYGRLYNWFVVDNNAATKVGSNGGKNVCPIGWHVPSDNEWTTLTTYLGGEPVAGGKLKETGTIHWLIDNIGATNESGFTALPSGYRNNGIYCCYGTYGYWWGSTESSNRGITNGSTWVHRPPNPPRSGSAVRCVRD